MLLGGWLFPGLDPVDPLTPRQFNRAIHDAAEVAHIDKRLSMHSLRHYLPFLTMSREGARAVWHEANSVAVQRRCRAFTRHSPGTYRLLRNSMS